MPPPPSTPELRSLRSVGSGNSQMVTVCSTLNQLGSASCLDGPRRILFFFCFFLSSEASFCGLRSTLQEASFAGIRGVIGSRPPTCEGRCRSCGHCEAVQVPVSPQQLQRRKKEGLGLGSSRAAAAAAGGRARAMPASYYDHSNYKPLSWRCKCGRHILDP